MVKSSAEAVPSSATVMVLLAPKATGQEIFASSVPLPASFMVMLPPNVSVPVPVIEAPIMAPPSIVTLVGVLTLNVDKLKTVLSFIVNAPPIVVLAVIDLIPLPSIDKLLNDVADDILIV